MLLLLSFYQIILLYSSINLIILYFIIIYKIILLAIFDIIIFTNVSKLFYNHNVYVKANIFVHKKEKPVTVSL